MDKDNASPTILNPNQLPTRRRQEATDLDDGPGKEIAELLKPRVGYVIEDEELSDPESQSDEVDPIDEQEIYGEHFLCHPLHALHTNQMIRASQKDNKNDRALMKLLQT